MPFEPAGGADAQGRARRMLERVGLAERLGHYPRQLSGGEQQRVAVARAFVTEPRLLFADEPTGNLDSETGEQVIDLLFEMNRERGTTLVLVTHDTELAKRCARRLHIAAGVQAALDRQANELLGGDLVVISDHPLASAFGEAAAREGLDVATTRTFPSMVSAEGGVNLAEIKAASSRFPLRGRLRVTTEPRGAEHEVEGGPKPWTVWIGLVLVWRLGAQVSDVLQVGRARLEVAAIITREPDSVLDYFGIAPRVLMNEADVDATGLVQVGSRITYRLLVGGDAAALQRFRKEMTPRIERGERMEGVRDARSEVRTALERSQRFLGLASLLSVVLASVPVALAARRFSQRQIDAAAMMRCLGASQASLFAIHAWQFIALGVAACIVGSVLGYGAQAILARWLGAFFTVELPLPGPLPALRGVVIGFVLLLGFTLPPLIRLRNAATMRVLRRDLAGAEPLSLAAFALGLAALCALILWQAGDPRLGSNSLGGFAVALVVSAAAGYALIRLVAPGAGAASRAVPYWLSHLRRRTGARLL